MKAEVIHIYFNAQYQPQRPAALLAEFWIKSVAAKALTGEKPSGKKETERGQRDNGSYTK